MQKKERQNSLLTLIEENTISNQADLTALLKSGGFSVTQASVSRDLDELGIIKINGRYSRFPQPSATVPEFGRLTLDTAGENLIVGRCQPGLASAITVRIDSSRMPEIVGTIAGDDTIFIAVKTEADQSAAMQRIDAMFR